MGLYHNTRRDEEMIRLREELESKTNELNTVKSVYESKIRDLEEKSGGKPKEKNINSNEKVYKQHLTYVDAINLKNMIRKYAEYPYGAMKDVKDSIGNIVKKNLQRYLNGKLEKSELGQIFVGLDEGKSKLYENMTGGYTSEKKNLAKYVEDVEERLRYNVSLIDSGNVGFLDKLMLYL